MNGKAVVIGLIVSFTLLVVSISLAAFKLFLEDTKKKVEKHNER